MALAQTALLARVDLLGARPDLMLLVVLTWAMVRGLEEGLVWGFAGGLIIDLLSGGPLGASSLALLAVAVLGSQPWGLGLGWRFLRLLLLTFLGVMAYHLILLTVLAWTGHAVAWGFSLTRVAVPSALLNVILAPCVRAVLAWLERRTRREGIGL